MARLSYALALCYLLLLTPTACTGPTIQMDLYVYGYSNGVESYMRWDECDEKTCDKVCNILNAKIDGLIIEYSVFHFDSVVFIGDCWTNECPDTTISHIYLY